MSRPAHLFIMKRIIALWLLALIPVMASWAQEYRYVEASDLTVTGKVFPDIPDQLFPLARIHALSSVAFGRCRVQAV